MFIDLLNFKLTEPKLIKIWDAWRLFRDSVGASDCKPTLEAGLTSITGKSKCELAYSPEIAQFTGKSET